MGVNNDGDIESKDEFIDSLKKISDKIKNF